MAFYISKGRWPDFRDLSAGVVLACLMALAVLPVVVADERADARRPATLPSALNDAQALLAAGKAQEAWALLAPLELDAAGSTFYDYLYGIAALDTGRPAAAIPALERVLASEPGFAGARVELARAHYEAGDYPAAEEQFQYLLTQDPPPATRGVIERYLIAMDEGAGVTGGGRSRFVPYGEIGAGWDSNANASTGSDNFGVIVLDPDNVETSSPFVELAAGAHHGYATEPGGVIISSGRASYRFNPEADFVDQALLSLGSLGQKSWGATRGSVGASAHYSWLDGSQHELGAGIDLGLAQRLGNSWEVSSVGRAGIVRFQQDELEILDVNRYLGSLALTRLGIGPDDGRLGLAVLFGTDDAQEASSAYGNDRLGARLFGGWQMASGSHINLEVAWLETDYDDTPGFTDESFSYVDRQDDQWTVALTTDYRDWPASGYSLVPTLRYIRTDSTVSLYDYDRFEIGVYLRRSKR